MLIAQLNLPVPMPIAFDASASNLLRLPWILMPFVRGTTVKDQWRYMNTEEKDKLRRELAMVHVKMFAHNFAGIGIITPATFANDPDANSPHATWIFILVLCLFAATSLLSLAIAVFLITR